MSNGRSFVARATEAMPQTAAPLSSEEAPNDDSAPPTAGAGAESPTIEAPEAGVRARLLGFYFFGAIIYSAVVFGRLQPGAWRWGVTITVVVAAVVLFIAAPHLGQFQKWLNVTLPRWGVVAGDLAIFLLVVAAIVLAAVWLKQDDQIVLLKLFAVLFFSLLPAFLFLQFSSRKTLTIWKEYVANLYRLGADEPASLPRPSQLSRFYDQWHDACNERGVTLPEQHKDDGANEEDDVTKIEEANVYRRKFEDLFGPVPKLEDQHTVASLKSVNKLQVVVTTVLVTIGWMFVLTPQSLYQHSITPGDFTLKHLPEVPAKTFAFAFLGAYFYVLQMLVRRYFQNDLKATAYINATMRIVIVILLVWVLDPLLADAGWSQNQRSALAFVIGVFPTVGWQVLVKLLLKIPGVFVSSLEPTNKLTDLDGLNIWYESRLLEVGVEDMQHLATTDIVDLMLNTRIPVDRLVDWIDQTLLYIRVDDATTNHTIEGKDVEFAGDRTTLRKYGIRSATDLLDVLKDKERGKDFVGLLNHDAGLPSRMQALEIALQGERNLQYVQQWRRYVAKEEVAQPVRAAAPRPESNPERPPDAAPVPA
jgi:hypothetical protein